jgi:selenide,water dikinase
MIGKEAIQLTAYSKGAGCGCKISPSALREILLTTENFPTDPRLIVGNDTNDDASVIDLGNEQCLISTTDFFMPVVDDARTFGKIAATNALSDVYAMGGKPLTALAILGWPIDKLPASMAAEVLDGARFICRVAGITLAGGHSIESAEPFFGLSVNGLVAKEHIKRNSGAQAGDLLFMTKPLGMGIITTAAKRGLAEKSHLEECIGYMCTLNKVGEELGKMTGVHALTDVTGFGLAGHLIEMCVASGLSAEVDFSSIPVFPFLQAYLDKMIYPDMTMKNYSFFSGKINQLNAQQLFTLCDPQTSGGLLVSVSPEAVDDYKNVVAAYGHTSLATTSIGKMIRRGEKMILVV